MINELENKEESENMCYQNYYKGNISVAINFKCVLGVRILKHALKGAYLIILANQETTYIYKVLAISCARIFDGRNSYLFKIH